MNKKNDLLAPISWAQLSKLEGLKEKSGPLDLSQKATTLWSRKQCHVRHLKVLPGFFFSFSHMCLAQDTNCKSHQALKMLSTKKRIQIWFSSCNLLSKWLCIPAQLQLQGYFCSTDMPIKFPLCQGSQGASIYPLHHAQLCHVDYWIYLFVIFCHHYNQRHKVINWADTALLLMLLSSTINYLCQVWKSWSSHYSLSHSKHITQ